MLSFFNPIRGYFDAFTPLVLVNFIVPISGFVLGRKIGRVNFFIFALCATVAVSIFLEGSIRTMYPFVYGLTTFTLGIVAGNISLREEKSISTQAKERKTIQPRGKYLGAMLAVFVLLLFRLKMGNGELGVITGADSWIHFPRFVKLENGLIGAFGSGIFKGASSFYPPISNLFMVDAFRIIGGNLSHEVIWDISGYIELLVTGLILYILLIRILSLTTDKPVVCWLIGGLIGVSMVQFQHYPFPRGIAFLFLLTYLFCIMQRKKLCAFMILFPSIVLSHYLLAMMAVGVSCYFYFIKNIKIVKKWVLGYGGNFFPKLNVWMLILSTVLLFGYAFEKNLEKTIWNLYSEIGLNLYAPIFFFGLIGFLYYLFNKRARSLNSDAHILVVAIMLFILSSLTAYFLRGYIPNELRFHSKHIPNVLGGAFIVPIGIYMIVTLSKNKLLRLVCIFSTFIAANYIGMDFESTYTKTQNDKYREITSQTAHFYQDISGEIIAGDSTEFLLRYLPSATNSFVFAANSDSDFGGRPFTSLPPKKGRKAIHNLSENDQSERIIEDMFFNKKDIRKSLRELEESGVGVVVVHKTKTSDVLREVERYLSSCALGDAAGMRFFNFCKKSKL